MYNYIQGTITGITSSGIILDNNGIGYNIFVANPYSFTLNNNYKVYLYNKVAEDENSLYGFQTEEERDLFLKLINVKGLGPKIAIPILASGSVSGIVDAIDRENVLYLKKFPKVGEKLARQIILDLKGKLTNMPDANLSNNELIEALESLGYKSSDIKKILPNIDYNETIENQIKQALKLLLRG